MDVLISVVLPLGLAFIMFTLGVGLTPADFARVGQRPLAFFIGALNQSILLPLVTFICVLAFGIRAEMAVGFMILAACPGGVTSNVISKLAKGDVALSVSLTAVISLASVVTVPLILGLSMGYFMGDAAPAIDITKTAVTMFVLTVVPVTLGLGARAMAPAAMTRAEPKLSAVATILFAVIVLAALAANWALFVENIVVIGPALLVLLAALTTIGFAGFLSKDAVIESAYAGTNGGFAFWALVIAALFTSFYSWRLIFMTFYGKPRGDKHTHEHAHESPMTMLVPLGVLAVGSVFAGMIWYSSFFGKPNEVVKYFGGTYGEPSAELVEAVKERSPKASELHYVMESAPGEAAIYMAPENTVLHEAHYVPTWVKLSPFIAMLIGFGTAFWFYIVNPGLPKRLAEQQRPLYLFLLNKWYFDEAYDFLFVQPAKAIGRFLWKRGDEGTIDGTINGVSMGVIPFFTRLAGRFQSGYIFSYAFAMVIGLALLITWMTIGGGAH